MNLKHLNIVSIALLTLLASCTDYFLNLEDPAKLTDESYFYKPEHFREAADYLHSRLDSYRMGDLGMELYDYGSDLNTVPMGQAAYAYGNITIETSDGKWSGAYSNLRTVNNLLERAAGYGGNMADIAAEVAEAKFFRAWFHFWLMERFGGVPIVTHVLETDSEELYGARKSRYLVTEQILKDLDEAIPDLPIEANIASDRKGTLSQGAAKAFKAKVLLHEATWMKYVGTDTDGDGTTNGAGSEGHDAANIDIYLKEAAKMAEEVMADPSYELWDYNSQLQNLSSYFLFNLEGAHSNPLGLDKSSIKEFILLRKHDADLWHSGSVGQMGRNAPSRKMMDMILCSDGLPIEKSAVFQGYANAGDEYKNRDYRMRAYFGTLQYYGDYNDLSSGAPTNDNVMLPGFNDADNGSGYKCQKYMRWGEGDPSFNLPDNRGMDRPLIRLAEVYLIYAEALYELNGSLTDAELEASINKTRHRAGLPGLTNSFITSNSLDLQEEIRRERAIELYAERNRFFDLRRWGIVEQELSGPIAGMIVEGTPFENNATLYAKDEYPNGEIAVTTPNGQTLRAVQLETAASRNFQKKHYLFPIPSGQILLNQQLLQNPDY